MVMIVHKYIGHMGPDGIDDEGFVILKTIAISKGIVRIMNSLMSLASVIDCLLYPAGAEVREVVPAGRWAFSPSFSIALELANAHSHNDYFLLPWRGSWANWLRALSSQGAFHLLEPLRVRLTGGLKMPSFAMTFVARSHEG